MIVSDQEFELAQKTSDKISAIIRESFDLEGGVVLLLSMAHSGLVSGIKQGAFSKEKAIKRAEVFSTQVSEIPEAR